MRDRLPRSSAHPQWQTTSELPRAGHLQRPADGHVLLRDVSSMCLREKRPPEDTK